MFQQSKAPSYMQELDAWAEEYIIGPLIDPQSSDPGEDPETAIALVKKAIREKVLESYHNGQKAGPRKEMKVRRYATP